MAELWYCLDQLPDLTLNKYASLEGSGVDGVIQKHIAFLRQLNRKGIVSGLSFHLFYLYTQPEEPALDRPGQRLKIFLLVRGRDDALRNVPALIKASPLSELYPFRGPQTPDDAGQADVPPASLRGYLAERGLSEPVFPVCCALTKSETLLPSENGESGGYYMIRDWEMNEDGRLYNMCTMMEALGKTALYRVDLYPVERSAALREALRKPMSILRKRQDERAGGRRDYDGKDVLDSYDNLIEKFDSSPHFIANIFVLAGSHEDAASILDAAGAESLMKGKYTVATFSAPAEGFRPLSFLDGVAQPLENLREHMVMRTGKPGLIVCREDTANLNLNYLPSLFSLEEIAPFFRLPALYDGETIQLPKETAPPSVGKTNSLTFGQDKNGYPVHFPLSLLPKHAFISGVPGSGKTNTMHLITSSLWKEYGIPFLVLEPAKQEYRALVNDAGMQGLYLFSPNADMSFPLHINPFEMPKDTLVAEHIRRLCSVFEGAFPLEPPMPFLLDTAIEAVYRELGWIPEHIYTGEETVRGGKAKRSLPTMSMLYHRLEQELRSTQYSDEVRGNLESALKVRIGSLLRREMGDVFDVPRSTFPPEKWLQIPAIIELESMGAGPANFLTLMLCSLIRETLKADSHRRHDLFEAAGQTLSLHYVCTDPGQTAADFTFASQTLETYLAAGSTPDPGLTIPSSDGACTLTFLRDGRYVFQSAHGGLRRVGSYTFQPGKLTLIRGSRDVRHVIFIEEAHNLIGPESEEQTGADADPKAAATAFIVKMLAEVRALNEGIFIADQLPTVMAQEVLKNTGLKIGLRITSADDRSLLGSTMAASSLQLEQMATFGIGESLVFYEKLMRPFNVRIARWECTPAAGFRGAGDPTEPQNDKALQIQLRDNPEYRDENHRSIQITGQKYYLRMKELGRQIDDCICWYQAVRKEAQRLAEDDRLFVKLEMEPDAVTPEQKALLYDQNNMIRNAYRLHINDSEKNQAARSILQESCQNVFALKRLKNDRWTRFGADEIDLCRITVLQAVMAENALRLFRLMETAAGQDSARILGPQEADCADLAALYTKLSQELAAYVQQFGPDMIQEHI